jgi:N-acetylglucosamine malate deacetylase 1
VGGLPLRLREEGWRVVNIAITLGSKADRQLARAEELQAACAMLGFECLVLGERGLSEVNPAARNNSPSLWQTNVRTLAAQLQALRPKLVMCPHVNDAQATHIGTHWLTLDALNLAAKSLPGQYAPMVALSEYWSTLDQPNLLLELSIDHVSRLICALGQHHGEVVRNPYHLTVPAWMMDNVRRGAERVGGAGVAAPAFTFATLYELSARQSDGTLCRLNAARLVAAQQRITDILVDMNPSFLLSKGLLDHADL